MPATPPTINVAALQALADAASSPGAVTVKSSSRVLLIQQIDKKGRNRAAPWTTCSTCNGAREIKAADGLWDDCVTCEGEGAVMGDVPTVTIPTVQVIAGRTTHEMMTLAGADANRPDQWTARPQADINAFVTMAAQNANKG